MDELLIGSIASDPEATKKLNQFILDVKQLKADVKVLQRSLSVTNKLLVKTGVVEIDDLLAGLKKHLKEEAQAVDERLHGMYKMNLVSDINMED